jgi:hypothetical protein
MGEESPPLALILSSPCAVGWSGDMASSVLVVEDDQELRQLPRR